MNKKIISILLLLLVTYLLFSKDDLYEGFNPIAAAAEAGRRLFGGPEPDPKCISDAEDGKCIHRESKRMRKECPKECLEQAKTLEKKRPSPEQTQATGEHPECWKWAMRGECALNHAYMQSSNGCKQSCDIIYNNYDLLKKEEEEESNNMLSGNVSKNIPMGDHPSKNIQMGDHPSKNISLKNVSNNISLKNISLKNNDSVCSNKNENENRIDCIKNYIFADGLYGEGAHPGDKEGEVLLKLLNTSADELNMSIQDRNDAISIMLQEAIKELHGPNGDRALHGHIDRGHPDSVHLRPLDLHGHAGRGHPDTVHLRAPGNTTGIINKNN